MLETASASDAKRLVLTPQCRHVKTLLSGLQLNPLPPPKERDNSIAHAPKRNHSLAVEGQKVRHIPYQY